jgi:hypothetical protein
MALKAAALLVALLLYLSTLPTTGAVSRQILVTEISGGLTLTGTDSLVITNKNYIVNGSIIIGDDASLTLVNSHLDFTESREWKFELSGNGAFSWTTPT